MDSSFVDLDILLTKVRNPQSRVYFLDAVRAYKAGALRASLTAAWVAIAPILQAWQTIAPQDFPNYRAGEWGPAAAEELIGRDGRSWFMPVCLEPGSSNGCKL